MVAHTPRHLQQSNKFSANYTVWQTKAKDISMFLSQSVHLDGPRLTQCAASRKLQWATDPEDALFHPHIGLIGLLIIPSATQSGGSKLEIIFTLWATATLWLDEHFSPLVSSGGQPINGHPADCSCDPPGERAHHRLAVWSHWPLLCLGQDVWYVVRKLRRSQKLQSSDSDKPPLNKYSLNWNQWKSRERHRVNMWFISLREQNSPLTAKQNNSRGQLNSAALLIAWDCFHWCGSFCVSSDVLCCYSVFMCARAGLAPPSQCRSLLLAVVLLVGSAKASFIF